jgi:hypothetical protein
MPQGREDSQLEPARTHGRHGIQWRCRPRDPWADRRRRRCHRWVDGRDRRCDSWVDRRDRRSDSWVDGATGAATTGPTGATGPDTGAAGGDLTGSYPAPTIAAGVVSNAKLADPSLSINPGVGLTGGGNVALGGSSILSVTDGGIGSNQLADAAVTTAKFGAGAVAPNAAQLNGIASSGFINGTGHYAVAGGFGTSGSVALFFNGGVAGPADNLSVLGDCSDSHAPSAMAMRLLNNSGNAVPIWTDVAGAALTEATIADAGATAESPTVPTSNGAQHITYHALTVTGPVTITVWDYSLGGTCWFSAEATVGF